MGEEAIAGLEGMAVEEEEGMTSRGVHTMEEEVSMVATMVEEEVAVRGSAGEVRRGARMSN